MKDGVIGEYQNTLMRKGFSHLIIRSGVYLVIVFIQFLKDTGNEKNDYS